MNCLVRSLLALATNLFVMTSARAETPIEVQTFWVSDGERAAFAELVKHGREAGLVIEPVLLDEYNVLREQTYERVAVGYPPEISHWVGGKDHELLVRSGVVFPVPDTVGGQAIGDVLFEEVLGEITVDGVPHGIPIGVHLQDIIVYNKKLLARVGYETFPKS